MYFCQVTFNPTTSCPTSLPSCPTSPSLSCPASLFVMSDSVFRHARPDRASLRFSHPFFPSRPTSPLRHARPDRASPANQSASSRTRSPVKPGMTMEVKPGITSLFPSQAPYLSSRVQANAFCHPERSRRPTFFVIPSRNPSCHLERRPKPQSRDLPQEPRHNPTKPKGQTKAKPQSVQKVQCQIASPPLVTSTSFCAVLSSLPPVDPPVLPPDVPACFR